MYSVFKFGGASIKDVSSIVRVGNILQSYIKHDLVIVFSAIGKVTNMLEDVVGSYFKNDIKLADNLDRVKKFHLNILNKLFAPDHKIFDEVNNLFVEIEWVLEEEPPYQDYAYVYDQIVSVGEFLSTKIMSAYLHQIKFQNSFIDARDLIRTDNSHRNAKVNWEETTICIQKNIKSKHCITQGFLGCTSENLTTTLGREGSDFTAAILAFALDANEVIIWKDVPGMMNADPKNFSSAKLLEKISFDEAIELAYFGAKVIHPKTIQPLKKKQIPLHIKSFLSPESKGSKIMGSTKDLIPTTSFIVKRNQILISISDSSLSFIVETHMSKIFGLLAKYSIRVNMMQNSAISFSVCVDDDQYKIPYLIADLKEDFLVYYNHPLSLYTIRHYVQDSANNFIKDKKVLLEQRSRNTLQLVVAEN